MDILFYLWVGIGILMVAGTAVYAGFNSDEVDDPVEAIGASAFIAVVWPFFVALVVAASPLIGLFYLGKYLKNRPK